jgi:hypothetical protein
MKANFLGAPFSLTPTIQSFLTGNFSGLKNFLGFKKSQAGKVF